MSLFIPFWFISPNPETIKFYTGLSKLPTLSIRVSLFTSACSTYTLHVFTAILMMKLNNCKKDIVVSDKSGLLSIIGSRNNMNPKSKCQCISINILRTNSSLSYNCLWFSHYVSLLSLSCFAALRNAEITSMDFKTFFLILPILWTTTLFSASMLSPVASSTSLPFRKPFLMASTT